MKIAILIRGHIRTYKTTYPILKKLILDNFDYDIFIHSWNANEKVINLYKKKVSKIEENLNEHEIKDFIKNNIYYNKLKDTYKNQIYSNYILTNILKKYSEENNINYDYVLYTRFDISYNNNIINLFKKSRNRSFIIFDPNYNLSDISIICDFKTALLLKDIYNYMKKCKRHNKKQLEYCYLLNLFSKKNNNKIKTKRIKLCNIQK